MERVKRRVFKIQSMKIIIYVEILFKTRDKKGKIAKIDIQYLDQFNFF